MPISKINRPNESAAPPSVTFDGSPMLTVPEAAAAMRVSTRTVYRLIDSGRLPRKAWTNVGKRRFIFRDRLADLINEGGIPL